MQGVRGPTTKNVADRAIGLWNVRVGPSAPYIATVTPVLTTDYSVGSLASCKTTINREFYAFESGTPKQLDGQEVTRVSATIEAAFQELSPHNFSIALGQSPFEAIDASAGEGESNTAAGTTDGALEISANNDGTVTDTFIVHFTAANEGVILGLATGQVHSFSDLTTAMEPDNGGSPYFSIPANFFTGTWAAGETYTFSTVAYSAAENVPGSNSNAALAIGLSDTPAYLRIEARQEFADGRVSVIILPRAQAASAVDWTPAEQESSVNVVYTALQAHGLVNGGNAAWNPNKAAGIGNLGRQLWLAG